MFLIDDPELVLSLYRSFWNRFWRFSVSNKHQHIRY